jgi:hypothetical protein
LLSQDLQALCIRCTKSRDLHGLWSGGSIRAPKISTALRTLCPECVLSYYLILRNTPVNGESRLDWDVMAATFFPPWCTPEGS